MASDILVVDDEADIRELISGILEDEGHSTRLAKDSDETLQAIEERRPSLVILDIWLQGSKLDGLELLDRIQQGASRTCPSSSSAATAISRPRSRPSSAAPTTISRSRSRPTGSCCITARALEASRLKRENRELRERSSYSFEMIGRSAAINQLRQAIDKVAPDQQPGADHRPVRLRQGACRPGDARQVGPRRRSVRGAECRRHGARPRGA